MVLRWEWADGRLIVENDRYGFQPCYYAASEQSIRVSSSITCLLAEGAPCDLDYEALAVFLRIGFFLGERTAFRGIRALPPGARLTWKDGLLSLTGGRPSIREQSLPRRVAIDGYIETFRAAIRRRLPATDRFTVPLSGGRDSRHILFALCDAGVTPPSCVSYEHYPPRRNPDTDIAARLCARLAIPHVVLRQREPRLRAELRKNRATGFCTDEHAQLLVLADHLQGIDTLYDGIAGDVLSGGLFLTAERLDRFARGDYDTLARELVSGRSERVREAVLGAEMYARLGPDTAIHAIADELGRHAEAPNPVGSFYFWNRTRREIALGPFALLQGCRLVHAPYLDREVFDFLSSLPVSLSLDHTFHSDAIARGYPHLADIPYAPKGSFTHADRWTVRRFGLDAAAYVAFGGPSSLVRRSYVLPRLVRAALDGDYGKLDWFGPILPIYLLQLERLISGLPSGYDHQAEGAETIRRAYPRPS